jgi:hypothetical protein
VKEESVEPEVARKTKRQGNDQMGEPDQDGSPRKDESKIQWLASDQSHYHRDGHPLSGDED